MTELAKLIEAAYKTERVRSRRLAKRAGLTESLALRQTLEAAAGALGLAVLLAARQAARAADASRRASRILAQADALTFKRNQHLAPASAWRAWFDGSAHPNPGNIGIGALLCSPDGHQTDISQGAGYGNSSQAEYLALIAVLEVAVQRRPAQLIVYGDSQVVIDDVKRTGAGALSLQGERARVLTLLAQLNDVTLRWIPRHKNGAADGLSQQAVQRAQVDHDTKDPS